MRITRVRITVGLLLVIIAVIAVAFGVERNIRLRRFRQHYLEESANEAQTEAIWSMFALELSGVPQPRLARSSSGLLPDGTAYDFVRHTPTLQISYPSGSNTIADEATVKRLAEMCRQAAADHAERKQHLERVADRPSVDPKRASEWGL
jgi:hypothetical protein